MNKTLNYLKEIFGNNLKTEYSKFYNAFPIYMTERYVFHFISIPGDSKSYVLVKPLRKIEINITNLKKQQKQIMGHSNSIPVFVFEDLRLSQRNSLIRNQIPFVQPNNQIFIPSVLLNLSQKEIIYKDYAECFSVATQVVYIYLLLNNVYETNAPRLAKEIPYSTITISRALAELENRNLIQTEGNNTRKIYKIENKKECFAKGKDYLFNPVDKVYYANLNLDHHQMFISNETALARLGLTLNESRGLYYATTAAQIKAIDKTVLLNKYDIEDDAYITLEQFKYNPQFLSRNQYIDIISLYAQMKNIDDERIQIAMDELLKEEDLI